MSTTIVDRLYQEYQDIVSFLDSKGEPSLRSSADETFRKAILLAAASFFEQQINDHIVSFCHEQSGKNQIVAEFVKNKALKRQYHTLFEWNKTSANHFFSLFGNEFKDLMITAVKTDDHLDKSIKAFLEIGRERNRLVHQDYGTFTLEKTADEIYKLYQSALTFVEVLPNRFRVKVEIQETPLANRNQNPGAD
jgi:hypothetical protein